MSLPSGYTRLEYIESTGTQYIDTGFKPNQDTRVVMDVTPLDVGGNQTGGFLFGSTYPVQQSGFEAYVFTGVMCAVYNGEQQTGTSAISAGTRLLVDFAKNVCTVTANNAEIFRASFTYGAFTSTVSLCLLCLPRQSKYFGICRLYSCKVYNSGVLVRDYIPAKNASGVVGLWDDANSVFCTNAGAGAFTSGPAYLGTHKTLINGTLYDVTGGKCLVGGIAYSIQKGRTLVDGTGYDIEFETYDSVFSNNTWAEIIKACHNNAVPETWAVGDSKEMTINGVSYQIDIIGKNHDTYTSGGTAPLTFQLHDCYAKAYPMNDSSTNQGGWTSCAMRQTHLPAILKLMPSEVQAGIREVNKLTSAGSQSSTINTTADKLFLLSEIELFSSARYSKSGEGTQYAYYKAGNSKIKNRSGSAANWWERSPYGRDSAYFCIVRSDGIANCNFASNTLGVAFGFCF